MVNVVIRYEEGYLESILVNGNEMEISEIQEDPIEVWFQKKSGRSNWKGLIEQIYEFIGNEDSEFVFELVVTDENKDVKEVFDRMLDKKKISEVKTIVCQSSEVKGMKAFQMVEEYNEREKVENSIGVEKLEEHLPKTVKEYLDAAGKGDNVAMRNLGEYYENYFEEKFSSFEVEFGRSREWYLNAIEDLKKAPMFNFEEYDIDFKDLQEAVNLFSKASENGNIYAMNNLGICYRYGIGVEQNRLEAINLFKRAAEKGNACAMNNLGICYRDGIGMASNEHEAYTWFEKAAENGNIKAMNNTYDIKWYRKAAEMGNVEAMYNLGVWYKFDYEQSKMRDDKQTAIKWLKKAAEKGHIEAKEELEEFA